MGVFSTLFLSCSWLAVRLEFIAALAMTGAALAAVASQVAGDLAFPALAGLSIATALSITQASLTTTAVWRVFPLSPHFLRFPSTRA
jgi:hypothetical protein